MEGCHDPPSAGHFGFKKTLERVKQHYYWPNMFIHIRAFVAKCQLCQQFKASNHAAYGSMSSDPPCMKPMRLWSMDIIGPLPKSRKQNRFALVAQDVATKYVVSAPMRSATSASVMKIFLNEIILIHGAPEMLMCDNGSAFISKEFKDFCKSYNVELRHIPKYYPRANQVERANRVVKTALSTYSSEDQRSWDEYLRQIIFAINTSVSESTSFTPARLVFGRELRPLFTINQPIGLITDFDSRQYDSTLQEEIALVYDKALKTIEKAKQQQAHQYNLRHSPVSFSVGDMVWRKNFTLSQGADYINAKMLPKYIGPFIIKKKWSATQFQLSTVDGKDAGRWSSVHLKPVT